MTNKGKKPATPVTKPFLTGTPIDGNTLKNALKLLGEMVLIGLMSFLVCTMTGMDNAILRIIINVAIITLTLYIFFNSGTRLGTEDVARGEILYRRQGLNQPISESERRLCFHSAKGFIIGGIAAIPLVLLALGLALTARETKTTAGVLPSWMDTYLPREEVGGALVSYTQAEAMSVIDVLRIIVRICIMPWVSMVGSTNRSGMLTLERLSPLVMLLPSLAFGFGYLTGKSMRARVHTEIAENARRRKRKETKARKARAAAFKLKEPEKLN